MTIAVLSETIAAQIAAGEVVERPASVVKELLENALDAGARSIGIEVRDGGRRLIRVSDDGAGIPAGEVAIAFYRHSTSKLTTAADLAAIKTLGFRGEALASIASVSRVTMVTRVAGEAAGTQIRIAGGSVEKQETVGAPQGTVVAVENLFYNVPARLKFLRTVTTEKRHIDALVTHYALAYPHVRFRLTHDNRQTFQSAGGGVLRDVLIDVYGLDTARQMLELEDSTTGSGENAVVQVSGFTSDPALSRSNRSHITLFVNGRWVQDTSLSYAVIRAYHTMLMTGRYPISVIMVTLPAELVDVNVHPTKAEVRFRDRDSVFTAVQRAVRRTLLQAEPVRYSEAESPGGSSGWTVPGRPPAATALSSLEPAGRVQQAMDLPGATIGQRGVLVQSPAGDERGGAVESANGDSKLPFLRPIGQIGAAFIVAEGPSGLVVIDQHAAHERILYEQFMAQRETGIDRQALLEALPVELPPDRALLLEDNLEVMAELGFEIEHFGGNTFMVRSVPALLGRRNPAVLLEAAVDDMERDEKPLEGALEAKIVARVCKTAAIKAGQVLTVQEMSAMVRQLEVCDSPHTCPHGRPTMIQMSAAQLARQFGRE